MNKTPLKIEIIFDDVSQDDFKDFLSHNFPEQTHLEISQSKENVRGVVDDIWNLVFSNEVAKDLIVHIIVKSVEYLFKKKPIEIKPIPREEVLVVRLLDGRKFDYPLSLGEEFLEKELAKFDYSQVKSIRKR